jgi:hypothetical protein
MDWDGTGWDGIYFWPGHANEEIPGTSPFSISYLLFLFSNFISHTSICWRSPCMEVMASARGDVSYVGGRKE